MATEIIFNECAKEECTFVKFTTRDGGFIDLKNVLLEYKCGEAKRKFKATHRGMVRLNGDAFGAAGTSIRAGDVVAWITGPCTHSQIMVDTCTICGTNLEELVGGVYNH